ncbi:OsmC-like protein [compost metagenome]
MTKQKIEMNTIWFKDAKGYGRIKNGDFQTQIAIPSLKGGSGDGADPQQLLISSAVACYTMTLAYMLDKSNVPVSGFFMDTEGELASGDQLSIIHRPHVVLKSNTTNDFVSLVEDLMMKAEEKCHVGQLLIKAGIPVSTQGKVSIDTGVDVTSKYIEDHGLEW